MALQRDAALGPSYRMRGGQERAKPTRPESVDRAYLTAALNVWTRPGEDSTFLTVLPAGTAVPVTGTVTGAWAEIVRDGRSRWVRAAYLAEHRPDPTPEATGTAATGGDSSPGGAISEAPCPSGSSVESGLTANAVAVHRAVCHQFPSVDSYGGYRPDGGEHGQGRALDMMVSSSALGDSIANWVRAHSQALGVSEVLWAQRIWTVQRSSEGWRWFEDRGSATANHYDHVHVTVY
ncbi:MAG: SH3 domain-containing protein [Nocardioidaceae bacterium]